MVCLLGYYLMHYNMSSTYCYAQNYVTFGMNLKYLMTVSETNITFWHSQDINVMKRERLYV